MTEHIKRAPHWPWLVVGSFTFALLLFLLACSFLLRTGRSSFIVVACLFLAATSMANFFFMGDRLETHRGLWQRLGYTLLYGWLWHAWNACRRQPAPAHHPPPR